MQPNIRKTMKSNNNKKILPSVNEFINNLEKEVRRKDSLTLIEMIQEQTGLKPEMWDKRTVSFGKYKYKYRYKDEDEEVRTHFMIAFSPRASALVLFIATDFEKREELLGKLGKYKTEKESKDYLHIKNFEDIDLEVLKEIITNHSKLYPAN